MVWLFFIDCDPELDSLVLLLPSLTNLLEKLNFLERLSLGILEIEKQKALGHNYGQRLTDHGSTDQMNNYLVVADL